MNGFRQRRNRAPVRFPRAFESSHEEHRFGLGFRSVCCADIRHLANPLRRNSARDLGRAVRVACLCAVLVW
jgi:hypothetical protein